MAIETDSILYLLTRIQEKAVQFISTEIRKEKIAGIIPIHGEILLALNTYGQLSMKRIAEIINRKKSTVTTLVQKLINLGYVEKKQNKEDNRSYLISLTVEGKALSDVLRHFTKKAIQRIYKDMPVAERKRLVASLKKINDNW